MKTGYAVGDAMTTLPVAVSPGTSIVECSRIMDKNHVGALIVRDKDKLVGLVTEQDIVRKAVAKGVDVNSKIKDITETEIVTIEPSADIYDALIKMKDMNIRHLPVLEGGKMVGLLTLKDALKIQPELFDMMVDKFELREEDRKPVPSEGVCQHCGEYSPRLYSMKGSLVCKNCR